MGLDRAPEVKTLRRKLAGLAAINNPLWRPGQPLPGDSHCNGGAQQIAAAMGCHDLDNLMADQQILKMQTPPGWKVDSTERAVAHAMTGGLAFSTISPLAERRYKCCRPVSTQTLKPRPSKSVARNPG